MARHLEVDLSSTRCRHQLHGLAFFRVGVLVRFKDERDACIQSRYRYLDGPIEMYVAGSHGIRYLFPIINNTIPPGHKPLYLHVIKPLVLSKTLNHLGAFASLIAI